MDQVDNVEITIKHYPDEEVRAGTVHAPMSVRITARAGGHTRSVLRFTYNAGQLINTTLTAWKAGMFPTTLEGWAAEEVRQASLEELPF